ncbi:MAG: hypothetical protein U0Q12_00175 [Vicinamibacterales bacterium]
MVVLLVSIAVMTVLMTVAMPTWHHQMQREKEEELIFRGLQYARAVALFQRKYPGAFPPNVQVLLDQKFLRRKFKDPMVDDGEFQVLTQTSALQQPGVGGPAGARTPSAAPGGAAGAGGITGQPGTIGPATGPGTSTLAGPQGGMIGVVSKSKAESIKLYNGRNKYNEWVFDFSQVTRQTTVPGANGGAAQPGQPTGPGLGPGQRTPPPGGTGGFGTGGFGSGRPGSPRPGSPGPGAPPTRPPR